MRMELTKKPFRVIVTLLLLATLGACAGQSAAQQQASAAPSSSTIPARDTHETLNGILWIETAAEYRMTMVQIYRMAKDRLDEALSHPDWTAAAEQIGKDYQGLPPAIILDVDETVLDNSRYQAELLLRHENYTPASWVNWMNRSASILVPGAKAFLDYAKSRGVAIYFVTNRDAVGEVGTARNLRAVGLDIDETMSNLMMRGEIPAWTTDKSSRRALIAQTHRILLLLGDDLNDFTSGVRGVDPEERSRIADSHRDFWGERWIMLPNPIYGSRQGAITRGAADDAAALAAMRSHLKGNE